jgi:hypothetical protein
MGEAIQISSNERPYFEGRAAVQLGTEKVQSRPKVRLPVEAADIVSKETRLEGSFRSHRKRGNSGDFETSDGKRVKYKYVGDDLMVFLHSYVSRGNVRVLGSVKYDVDGEPLSIQIREIEPLAIKGEAATT